MSGLKKILVVDDEQKITKLLKLNLQQAFECEVEVYNDPTEALARAQECKFDAISLDHRMPRLTGMGLIQVLRSTDNPNAQTPVVILTGYVEDAENLKNSLLTDVFFLDKSVENERYLRWMRIALFGLRSEAVGA